MLQKNQMGGRRRNLPTIQIGWHHGNWGLFVPMSH